MSHREDFMLGNFTYCNPTKLYFGKGAIANLKTELEKFGKNVMLVYGGGSIKKNGIYDQVIGILKECGKNVTEDAGVMPNPTTEKLYEGIARARACKAGLILAVGGGSVCDYSKAVSASVHCDEDPWDRSRCVRADDGWYWQRDERRLRHHQPCAKTQDRESVRRRSLPEVLHSRS